MEKFPSSRVLFCVFESASTSRLLDYDVGGCEFKLFT